MKKELERILDEGKTYSRHNLELNKDFKEVVFNFMTGCRNHGAIVEINNNDSKDQLITKVEIRDKDNRIYEARLLNQHKKKNFEIKDSEENLIEVSTGENYLVIVDPGAGYIGRYYKLTIKRGE